jgi:hypothetical protein
MIRSVDGKLESTPIVPNQPNPTQQTKAEQTARLDRNDRLELSDEARAALRDPERAKRQRIQAGIESGFYNSPQVLQTVAQRLLRDLDTSGSASMQQ